MKIYYSEFYEDYYFEEPGYCMEMFEDGGDWISIVFTSNTDYELITEVINEMS